MVDTTKQLLEFFSFCEQLKKLERFKGQVFWRDYPIEKYESVADHTWRMMLILISVEKQLSQPINLVKTMKMVVIHDLPEIIAGDLSPLGTDGTGNDSHAYDKKVAAEKYQNEQEAAKNIFGKVGDPLGSELMELWMEYEAKNSYEAKVANAVDKLEAKLQALEYTRNLAIPEQHLNFTTNYKTEACEIDPLFQALHEQIVAELEINFEVSKVSR